MAELGIDFAPDSVESERGFELLASGPYNAMIVGSNTQPTKNGDGKLLKLKLSLYETNNRIVFDDLTYVHPNEQTQTIARQRLKAYCEAVGFTGVLSESAVLHDIPITVIIGTQPAQNGYAAKNVVKAVKAISTTAGAKAPVAEKTAAKAETSPKVSTTTGKVKAKSDW